MSIGAASGSKLIFEDDDAARGVERSALIEQITDPRRNPELEARVSPVTALGSMRNQQIRLVETA